MIHIPAPWQLFAPKLPPSRGPGFTSLADGVLSFGGIGILFVVTVVATMVAYNLSPWLSIPGAVLAYTFCANIANAPPIFLGIFEALFYFCITFVTTDGLDRPDPIYSWVYSGIAAAVFLWASFSKWKDH